MGIRIVDTMSMYGEFIDLSVEAMVLWTRRKTIVLPGNFGNFTIN